MIYPDINCDIGEGIGDDDAMIRYISSASIACGYHAGNDETMKAAIRLCQKHQIHIGAHPSFHDRENFGNTDLFVPYSELYDLVQKQIFHLNSLATELGASLHHVRLHGALYFMTARVKSLAAVVALAVKETTLDLILYGLSNSHTVNEAKKIGVKTWSEVLAERTYADDGRLTAKLKTTAFLETERAVLSQINDIVTTGFVTSTGGKKIAIEADTVCIQNDGKHALQFAKALANIYKKNNTT